MLAGEERSHDVTEYLEALLLDRRETEKSKFLEFTKRPLQMYEKVEGWWCGLTKPTGNEDRFFRDPPRSPNPVRPRSPNPDPVRLFERSVISCIQNVIDFTINTRKHGVCPKNN
jgi:hypothetical protein